MKFLNNNKYIMDLNNEILILKDFMKSFLSENYDESIFELTENSLNIFFDYNHILKIKDTSKNFIKVINKLLKKYKSLKNIDEEEIFILNTLVDIKILLDDGDILKCLNSLLQLKQSRNEDIKKDFEELYSAFLNTHFGSQVSGFYNHKLCKMTLFTKSISDLFEEYLYVFSSVFYLAYYHHLLSEKGSDEEIDSYYHEVVLSSLSSYFAIEYLKFRGIESLASDKYLSKLTVSPILDPDAGVKYFDKDKVQFNSIMKKSLSSFEEALRSLVPLLEAEIIMQMEPRAFDLEELDIRDLKEIIESQLEKDEENNLNHKCRSCRLAFTVIQNSSFIVESKAGNITIPVSKKTDKRYEMFFDIKANDIIYHISERKIMAVSVVTKEAYIEGDYVKVDCDYRIIENPINLVPLSNLLKLLSAKYSRMREQGAIRYVCDMTNEIVELYKYAIKASNKGDFSFLDGTDNSNYNILKK